MTLTKDKCNETSSLFDLCSQFVAENGQVIFAKRTDEESYKEDDYDDEDEEERERRMTNDDIVLPVPVSESLFDAFRRVRASSDSDDRDILEFFANARKTPLWNMNLESSQVTDAVLTNLLREHGQNLLSLNLSECEDLTELINYHLHNLSAPKLRTLNLGSLVKLFGPWLIDNTELSTLDASMKSYFELETSVAAELGEIPTEIPLKVMHFNPIRTNEAPSTSVADNNSIRAAPSPRPILTNICPNLLNFTLHGDQIDDVINADVPIREQLVQDFFHTLLQPLTRLIHLDLSYWSSVNDLSFLNGLHLRCLILYEVPDLNKAVDVICNIKTLEHLDVSQSSPDTGVYPNPATTLDRFVNNLSHLNSLDITSTNLASNPTKGDWPPLRNGIIESDIAGLTGLQKPLEYLGIFLCDSASHYQRIPAISVAGDGSEQQILVAIEKYINRPALLVAVLNEAYQTYRFGVSVQHARALHLMLDAMTIHLMNANIQIASSASIFYIIRNLTMNSVTKKKVIAALLNAMQHHMQEQTLVRNCCLSLCQFEVPLDILHDYERAVRLLLRVLQVFSDQMTQRIVIYLLNSLACHVDGHQKITVGNLGAVEVILEVISRRVEAGVCDEVMEVSWSFLWNITDETPINCNKFLNNHGMELFQKCKEKFPDRTELLRNMMGLMGNIAEVKELRFHLMQSRFVSVFCELLNNTADGIEISYNSAGVLAHMISDGDEVWTFNQPTREEASACVVRAVQKWQLNAKRFINYRSFEPILRLLPLENSYASTYWAVWALANLTTVDGPKYCGFIIDEKGVPLLQGVLSNPKTDGVLRELARKVLQNVQDNKGVLVL